MWRKRGPGTGAGGAFFGGREGVMVLVVLVYCCMWCWFTGGAAFSGGGKLPPPMEEPVQFGETRQRPNSALNPKPLLGGNLILQLVGFAWAQNSGLDAGGNLRG